MTLVVQNIILRPHRIQHFSRNWLLSFWPAPQEYQLVVGRVIQTWTKPISHVLFINSLELFWFYCSVAQSPSPYILDIEYMLACACTAQKHTHTFERSLAITHMHSLGHSQKKHTKTLGKRVLCLSFFLFSLCFSPSLCLSLMCVYRSSTVTCDTTH